MSVQPVQGGEHRDINAKEIKADKIEIDPIMSVTQEQIQVLAQSLKEHKTRDIKDHQINPYTIPPHEDETTTTLMNLDSDTVTVPFFPKQTEFPDFPHNTELSQDLIAIQEEETEPSLEQEVEEEDLLLDEITDKQFASDEADLAEKENVLIKKSVSETQIETSKEAESASAEIRVEVAAISPPVKGKFKGLIFNLIQAALHIQEKMLKKEREHFINVKFMEHPKLQKYETIVEKGEHLSEKQIEKMFDILFGFFDEEDLLVDNENHPVSAEELEEFKEELKETLLEEFQKQGWIIPVAKSEPEKQKVKEEKGVVKEAAEQAAPRKEKGAAIKGEVIPPEAERVVDMTMVRGILAIMLTDMLKARREKEEKEKDLKLHDWILMKETLRYEISRQALKHDIAKSAVSAELIKQSSLRRSIRTP